MDAAGPDFGTSLSLYRTPLGSVLPAEPTGNVFEQGFVPRVSAAGERHPVTAELPGEPADPDKVPPWGRWFRQVEAIPHEGEVVMTGPQERPLLVLNRVGDGRVAELLSDEMWLWTRGYEGGGPQAELLRRVVYWLMKEPDLEENDLRAAVEGNRLVVTRQSLEPDDRPVTVTGPDGVPHTLKLTPAGGGRSTGALPVTESGLYRASDGTRTALAAAGALSPIELADVRTTDEKVKADVAATGGSIHWVGPGPIPDLRRVEAERSAGGRDWMGLRANGDYVVTGMKETPLLPGVARAPPRSGLLPPRLAPRGAVGGRRRERALISRPRGDGIVPAGSGAHSSRRLALHRALRDRERACFISLAHPLGWLGAVADLVVRLFLPRSVARDAASRPGLAVAPADGVVVAVDRAAAAARARDGRRADAAHRHLPQRPRRAREPHALGRPGHQARLSQGQVPQRRRRQGGRA